MGAAAIVVGVVCLQAASGSVWWAWARRGPLTWAELLGMGLALGTFGSMLSAMLLAQTPLDPTAWALPALGTIVALAFPRPRRALFRSQVTASMTQVVAVGLGIIAGGALLVANWLRVPLDDPSSSSFTDLYFFEAISRGLAEFGPSQSILMSGGSLRYHWFTYAWAGEVAQTASTASFVAVTRILPTVTLIGVSLLVAAWAGRLSRVRWVPSLAVLLVVAGGYTGALYGAVLNFDSPSQSMTTMWLLALGIAFMAVVHGRAGRAGGVVIVALLASACTGGKISHAAVAVGGIALMVLVGIVIRAKWWRRGLVAAVIAAVAMAVTYLWVLAGVAVDRNLTEEIAVKASTWQGLDPLVGRGGVILGTAALVLAIAARVAGVGWLLARPSSRGKPDVLFATGALAVGFAAMLILREGVNELWFVLAASAPAAVLSADGVGVALAGRARPPRPLVRPLAWSVAIAVPASLVTLVLTRTWDDHRALLNWLAPIAAWALVLVGALIVAMWRRPQGRVVVPALALAVAALTLTSILTRPAALWTSSRPITTERGEVEPDAGLPGEASAAAVPATAPPPASAGGSVSRRAAADWLVQHSGEGDVVATSDPVSAFVPALTGRQMYLAGDIYQIGLGRADELDDVGRRSEISKSLADDLSPEALVDLCANDVDYIWVEHSQPGPAGLPVAWAGEGDDHVTILELPADRCT